MGKRDTKSEAFMTLDCVETIMEECDRTPDTETGGILLGKKTVSAGRNIYIVQMTSGPGKDCRKTTVSFAPDMSHYNSLLVHYEKTFGMQYLGEWHKHPAGFERTSGIDLLQARKIFREEDRCSMLCPIVFCSRNLSGREAGDGKAENIEFGRYRMKIFHIQSEMDDFEVIPGRVVHRNTSVFRNAFELSPVVA